MSLAPYTASCVRVCALRGALLRPEEWQTLAALGGAAAVIDWLKQRGIFAAGVADVLSSERAAHEAVIRATSGLLRFVSGSSADLLGCFVHYYDLLNVESAVHRVHALRDESDPQRGHFYDTAPFGLIRHGALDAATDYPALARALRRTPFSAPFEAALLRYHEDEDAVRLVERVELAFFADWVRAAERCGLQPRSPADASALGVFLTARGIEAAVRLKMHRGAQTSRVVEWLSLIAPPARLDACLEVLSRESETNPVQELAVILLPGVSRPAETSQESVPRDRWGFLDGIVMRQALKATRGISFNADFLTGFLVRKICQARELTVLLESKEANMAFPAFAMGGAGS